MSLAIDNLDFSMSEVAHWEEYMQQQSAPVDIEALKKEVKKLNARATNLKMNLHDLAEDLPIGWEKIPEVAEEAYQAYKSLTEARSRLANAGG